MDGNLFIFVFRYLNTEIEKERKFQVDLKEEEGKIVTALNKFLL